MRRGLAHTLPTALTTASSEASKSIRFEESTMNKTDAWANAAAYEAYVGRWSRLVAREFIAWLAVPPGSHWLDVGCGTGALTEVILRQAQPRAVTGVDT